MVFFGGLCFGFAVGTPAAVAAFAPKPTQILHEIF